jgi:Enoyl-(Acyl carrier protein) reductase
MCEHWRHKAAIPDAHTVNMVSTDLTRCCLPRARARAELCFPPSSNLLTKVWAAEYGPSGVRVNAVSPGPTRTEGTDAMGVSLEQLAAQAPAGRPATADEIAEAIVFLATDRASFIHGAKLAVDGGRSAI